MSLEKLVASNPPSILFLNHTVDDFLALFCVLNYLSSQGVKIGVLQKNEEMNDLIHSFPGRNNIMFCDVNNSQYLDQFQQMIKEKRMIIMLPDAMYARHSNLNNRINFSQVFESHRLRHDNPILADVLKRDIYLYKERRK